MFLRPCQTLFLIENDISSARYTHELALIHEPCAYGEMLDTYIYIAMVPKLGDIDQHRNMMGQRREPLIACYLGCPFLSFSLPLFCTSHSLTTSTTIFMKLVKSMKVIIKRKCIQNNMYHHAIFLCFYKHKSSHNVTITIH